MPTLTKIKVRRRNETTHVLALVKHPMEAGNYIERMDFLHNGIKVVEALMGPSVAINPLTGIALSNVESGDKVAIRWIDNNGKDGGAETTID